MSNLSAHGDATPLLTVDNVSVSYWLRDGRSRRRHFALQDISFALHRGDSIGIVGTNGSGKSSLLRLLAGVMEPDTGRICGLGKISTSLLTLQLGFVDYLTGRENAILSGMYLGMPKRTIEALLPEIIEFAEIGEFIDQPIETYSAGMRARLGFAVSFQLQPDVLLVDEVLGVGDLAFREKATLKMKERLKCEDSTVVFVSHSSSEVRNLCNRALWLDRGKLMADGPAESVLDQYEDAVYARSPQGKAEPPPLFLRKENTKRIFMLHHGVLRTMRSYEEFLDYAGRNREVRTVNEEEFREILNSVKTDDQV